MDRRQFFKSLGGGAAALSLTSLAKAQAAAPLAGVHKPRRILDTKLAGYPYYAADKVLARMKPGDELLLRVNPNNPHDARAVEVWWRAHKLGHIPRADNASISQLLAQKESLFARLDNVDAREPQWDRISLSVYLT